MTTSASTMTLGAFLTIVRNRLGSRFPSREAEAMTRVITEDALGYEPVEAVLHKDSEISQFMQSKVNEIVERVLNDEPLQYVLGMTRFYGMDLKVTPAVLIPRPETEELIDIIVKKWDNHDDLEVLDLCTGSGCIALALGRTLKFADVTAVDISSDALEIAEENSKALHMHVTLRKTDVLALTPPEHPVYDIIVSNPPYVAEHEKASMQPNVLKYEPATALFVPDSDPLLLYKPIGRYAAGALKAGGMLYLEANPLYISQLKSLLESFGLRDVQSIADMTGRQRFVTALSPRDYD